MLVVCATRCLRGGQDRKKESSGAGPKSGGFCTDCTGRGIHTFKKPMSFSKSPRFSTGCNAKICCGADGSIFWWDYSWRVRSCEVHPAIHYGKNIFFISTKALPPAANDNQIRNLVCFLRCQIWPCFVYKAMCCSPIFRWHQTSIQMTRQMVQPSIEVANMSHIFNNQLLLLWMNNWAHLFHLLLSKLFWCCKFVPPQHIVQHHRKQPVNVFFCVSRYKVAYVVVRKYPEDVKYTPSLCPTEFLVWAVVLSLWIYRCLGTGFPSRVAMRWTSPSALHTISQNVGGCSSLQ